MCRIAQYLFFITLLIFSSSCQKEQTQPQQASPETYFRIKVADHVFRVQLALTPAEQQTGLMHRQTMDDDAGMLFVFQDVAQRSFWMKNTLIPLDILYIAADGRVLEVYQMYPLDEQSVQSISKDIVMALELNQGTAAKKNLQFGSQVDMETLRRAMRRRGVDLSSYPWLQE